MKSKLIRIFIFVLIIIGYSGFCIYIYGYSADNVKAYSDNLNSLKVSNNEVLDDAVEGSEEEFLGSISIPKISVSRNLYNIGSKENTVDKNIEVLKDSDMPDKQNGNFILAAHNGYTSVAYFHNLDKLSLDDLIYVNYDGIKYTYSVSLKYDVVKTGKVAIKRDKNKNTITLITCKGDDKQLVVIGYLIRQE